MTKRTCTETTKAGKPCPASPVKGYDQCMGHLDRETKERLGFGGSQPGSGRPRKPRVVDVILASITERAGEIDAGLWEATKAERAVVVGNGPTAHMEMVPDWPTRITAYRELMDRGHGRPTQVSEVTVITDDQLVAEIERMERELASNDPHRGGAADGAPVSGASRAA